MVWTRTSEHIRSFEDTSILLICTCYWTDSLPLVAISAVFNMSITPVLSQYISWTLRHTPNKIPLATGRVFLTMMTVNCAGFKALHQIAYHWNDFFKTEARYLDLKRMKSSKSFMWIWKESPYTEISDQVRYILVNFLLPFIWHGRGGQAAAHYSDG